MQAPPPAGSPQAEAILPENRAHILDLLKFIKPLRFHCSLRKTIYQVASPLLIRLTMPTSGNA